MQSTLEPSINSIPKKQPWYLNSIFICVLFSFWFIYAIPVVIGIILLLKRMRYDDDLYLHSLI